MKSVVFTKRFEKAYTKRIARNAKLKKAFDSRYRMFIRGERGAPLNDHALSGNLVGRRAFAISGDIRVICIDEPDCYHFIDIGTHAQVYSI